MYSTTPSSQAAFRTHYPTLVAISFFLVFASELPGGDWPRFRGANGEGIGGETAAPTTWSESENLKWKTPLPGPGSSSPIVSGDSVFVTCYSGYGDGSDGNIEGLRRHLVCIDRKSGSIRWKTEAAGDAPEDPYEGFITEHGYASSTPVTDGERVICYFGKAGAIAYDFDGNELWRSILGTESGSKRWGSGASPILYGDLVIVNASDEARALVALDKSSGGEKWRSEAASLDLAYGTPVIMKVADDRDDLIASVPGEVWGLNPASGKLRWFAESGLTGNVSPSPVLAGDSVIAFGGFPRTGSYAVRGGGKGDVTTANSLWESNRAAYITTSLYHGGHLYWVSDQGFAICVDSKSGAEVYRERVPDTTGPGSRGRPFYAAIVKSGEHLYAVSRFKGTFVIKASPEYDLVAQNVIKGDASAFHGTPAISGGDLFLRSNTHLYCIGTPGASPTPAP